MAVRDRYHLLSSVVRIANSTHLSHPARLKSLAKLLAATFKCSVTFYLLDEVRRNLTSRVSSAGPARVVNCLIPIGEGIAGLCAREKGVIRRGSASSHPDEFVGGNEEETVAMPVMSGHDLCGVATFGLRAGVALTAEDQAIRGDILTAAAGVVEGMQCAKMTAKGVDSLAAIGELSRLLNRSASPQELVACVLRICYERTNSCCVILRLLPAQGLPAGVYKKCQQRVRSRLASLLDTEAGVSARILEGEIPLLQLDATAELSSSCICTLLRFEGNNLGTMTFFSAQEEGWQKFDAGKRELLANMAVLIANALAGSATYQRMVRLGEENEKKLKELASLYRVSNTMLSTIRLNKLIHLILTVLTSGPDPIFERAMLFLINERAGVMQGMLGVDSETTVDLSKPVAEEGDLLASRWDIADEDMIRQRDSAFSRQVRESRLPFNKSLNMASRAVLEKRLIYVPDAATNRRVDRDFVRRFGITSFATAPLLAKERIVGVVVVDNPVQGKPIHQDDLRFLQLFMNQAGMAIENSLLYDRIEDANRSLRETQEQLLQGERLATIGEMAARIAHELKGPLVSIGGFARRLEKKLPADSTEWHYAETIVVEVLRLEKMLTDILSFSRKAIICYTRCNIVDIIESALAIASPAIEQGTIRVCKQFPAKPITFPGDSQQLKQVFINLFLNAQEAMKGEGRLDIIVAPARLNGKGAVSVKVADTGGGIPLEALNNIFNPFFTTKGTGTGLGLPIVNRIITNHGGKLHVSNRPGTGAEFKVLLPLQS